MTEKNKKREKRKNKREREREKEKTASAIDSIESRAGPSAPSIESHRNRLWKTGGHHPHSRNR